MLVRRVMNERTMACEAYPCPFLSHLTQRNYKRDILASQAEKCKSLLESFPVFPICTRYGMLLPCRTEDRRRHVLRSPLPLMGDLHNVISFFLLSQRLSRARFDAFLGGDVSASCPPGRGGFPTLVSFRVGYGVMT